VSTGRAPPDRVEEEEESKEPRDAARVMGAAGEEAPVSRKKRTQGVVQPFMSRLAIPQEEQRRPEDAKKKIRSARNKVFANANESVQ
jgi:hypothetical protein